MSTVDNSGDKPKLLQAIEFILADPADISKEARYAHEDFRKKHSSNRTDDEIADLVVDKIISNYSYYAAFSGGATALAGVIPGLGTAISVFGGSVADAALSMKYQIEMTMAIAVVYGRDITIEEEKRISFLVAGLGAINEAAKKGGKAVGSKAFIKMTKEYLKGSTLQAVKEIFKKVGITFTRKATEKAIPYGIGVLISFSTNKGLTWYVGSKARDFYRVGS